MQGQGRCGDNAYSLQVGEILQLQTELTNGSANSPRSKAAFILQQSTSCAFVSPNASKRDEFTRQEHTKARAARFFLPPLRKRIEHPQRHATDRWNLDV